MSDEERVDVVDEQDRVVGGATRAQMRAQNLLHRCVAILCLDSHGRIYVHRRTATKDVFPGLYDPSVGGVVTAGEDYDTAALREIDEELGIVGPTPSPLFKHRYEGPHSRSHTRVYRVLWDGPIRHQESEVAWGAHLPLADVARNVAGFRYVPDGWEIFRRYLEREHPAILAG